MCHNVIAQRPSQAKLSGLEPRCTGNNMQKLAGSNLAAQERILVFLHFTTHAAASSAHLPIQNPNGIGVDRAWSEPELGPYVS